MNRPDALPPEFTDSEPWTPRGRRGHDLEPRSAEGRMRPERSDNLAGCVVALFEVPADRAREPRQEAEQPPAC